MSEKTKDLLNKYNSQCDDKNDEGTADCCCCCDLDCSSFCEGCCCGSILGGCCSD